MVKRFLITTALEETWLEDETVLFLGKWCRRSSRKDRSLATTLAPAVHFNAISPDGIGRNQPD